MEQQAVPRVLSDAGLTPREREVFWLVADRLRNREIAERLYISKRTVESHVAALLRKLGGSDRSDLVALGTELRERLGTDHDLPTVLSSFVGREAEVAELSELVRSHRLVTLMGPAGVGKTRLALEVARAAPGMPPPMLVDLATIPAAHELDRAFASALGLVEDDRGLRRALSAALRHDRHWLVVDNCEHVLSAVAVLLGDLLSVATGLRVLATSRSPLRISGEVVYEVAPLSLPMDADDPSVVLQGPAARLLADRASTAAPGFEITSDNARAVATLCRRLDGLPLAIELAAARLRTFSARELLSHLDQRFQVLDAGRLDGAARHRTLDAALRWSYELLNDEERLVFERCSVFPGEFDYDTAAAVVLYPPLESEDFVRAFPRLLDRSLLSRRQLADQTTAYRMLETFRAFSRGQLEERGGADEVRRRHAAHHIDGALAAAAELGHGDRASSVRWFARRWIDLHTAMRWLLDHGQTERAWELLTHVGRRWDSVGIRGELFDWLEALLGRPWPAGDPGLDARITAGYLLFYIDADRALQVAEEALQLVPPTDQRRYALAELSVGWALGYVGDRDAATGYLGSALQRFRELGDRWREALATQGLGHAAQDVETMIGYLEQAAELFTELHDDGLRANCLTMMAARALEMEGPLDRIDGWLNEAYRLAERTDNAHERLHAELHRARLVQHKGDHVAAAAAFRELLPSLRRTGDHRCAGRCLVGLGEAALAGGDTASAREHLTSSVALADRVKDPRELAAGLRLLARSELEDGRATHAARLLGAAQVPADRLDPARRNGLPDVHDLETRIEERIGAEGFRSAFEEGRTRPPTVLLER